MHHAEGNVKHLRGIVAHGIGSRHPPLQDVISVVGGKTRQKEWKEEMDIHKRVGDNVAYVRRRLGLTQAEFAEKLRTGRGNRKWKQKTVSALENGHLEWNARDLMDMEDSTGLSAGWFVSHEIDLSDLNGAKPLYLNPIDPSWHRRDSYIALPNEAWWTDNHPAQPQREALPLTYAR